jgi:hypothetical protein
MLELEIAAVDFSFQRNFPHHHNIVMQCFDHKNDDRLDCILNSNNIFESAVQLLKHGHFDIDIVLKCGEKALDAITLHRSHGLIKNIVHASSQ